MKKIRISAKTKEYPARLGMLADPPNAINILGNLSELLDMTTVGIVGSRKASTYGRGVTEKFAEELAHTGLCIVSGLALGVDSIAHRSAVRAKGKTIAVLPSGLDEIYPASHRGLARDIISSGGALLSEYDDSFRPRRESFIQRNRIIAALSDVLLVTEAAEKSGSLYTANFALELGKTVLAVPGNITSPYSAGTNNLIGSGATLVSDTKDIFDALGINPDKQQRLDIYGDNEEEAKLLEILAAGISDGDVLLHRSGMEIQAFQQTLTMLEIKGAIAPQGSNRWRIK